jgi:hypothetical protein
LNSSTARTATTPASVTALVVPAGLLPLPPVAQAATSPTVSSFGAVAGDPGILRVAATSDTPIAPVTAMLAPFQGTGAAATVTTFEPVPGQGGGWQSARVVLPEYDFYRMSVDVAHSDGDHTVTSARDQVLYWPTVPTVSGVIGPNTVAADTTS